MNAFILHHDGKDWNLKHFTTHRVIARFQCRRTALRESLVHAHGSAAKLVLVPGPPKTR